MFYRSANDNYLFCTSRSPLFILVFAAATNYRPQMCLLLKSVNRNPEIRSYHSGTGEDLSLPDVTQDRGANIFNVQAVEEEQSA